MKEIIDVYEKVTERKNFKAGRVKMSPQTIHDHDLLLKAIHAFSPLGGWLCYQSKVVRLPEDSLPDDQGKLLYGELVNGRKSLHIRQKGANWLVNELDAGSGDDCLVRKISYPNGAKKFYRIILNKRQIGLQRIVGTNLQSPIGRVIKCKSDHRNTAGIRFLPKFS